MKNILVTVIYMLTAVGLFAVDNYHRLDMFAPVNHRLKAPDGPTDTRMLAAIIELERPEAVDSLRQLGVVIFHVREHLALACIPAQLVEQVEDLDDVRRVCSSPASTVALDRARAATALDNVHAGTDLPQGYTGRNVVVGFCDVGFDPGHIAFVDPATGRNRVSRVISYKESRGSRLEVMPDQYPAWQTDSTALFHATHVAGIMTGSSNEYSLLGVAPGAELMATVSELTDVGILAGAEDIIAYAKSVGKPAVINMSVGSYLGPHDGSTLFNEYLSMLGREAIICLASGNSGNSKCSFEYRPESRQSLRQVAVYGTDWVNFDIKGYIDLWADGDKTFDLSIGVLDTDTRRVIYSVPLTTLSQGDVVGIASVQPDGDSKVVFDAEFANYLEGVFLAQAELNTRNRRYNVTLKVDTHCAAMSAQGPWARFVPALIIDSEDVGVNGFADCLGTLFASPLNGLAVGPDLSVSDLACGDNFVCVGMYTTRSSIVSEGGNEIVGGGFADMTVNSASGYGIVNGNHLPHVCAPGAFIISAVSSPFIEANPDQLNRVVYTTTRPEGTYRWIYECGTSMATPFVAGTIALWLEAEPTLTVYDILDILENTNCRLNPPTLRDMHGWIDPAAGLRYIFEKYAGVDNVLTPGGSQQLDISVGEGVLTLSRPLPSVSEVSVYNISGQLVATPLTIPPGNTAVDIPALPTGCYIARLSSSSTTVAKRIFIR